MTDWKVLMLLTLPVLLAGSWRGQFRGLIWSPKIRTWSAMMGSSLAAWGLWSVEIYSVAMFAVLNCLAATIVLAPPKSFWQSCIGAIFAAMALFCVGFLWGTGVPIQENVSPSPQQNMLFGTLNALGFLQWAFLIVWGGYGVFLILLRRWYPRMDSMAVQSSDPS